MPDSRQPYLQVTNGSQSYDLTRGVQSVTVEDHDRLADKATVVLNDSIGVSADAFQNGQEIKVDMGWASEHAVVFEGVIHRTPASADAGSRRLTLIAYDLSTLMHGDSHSRTRNPGTLRDVLMSILNDYSRIKAGKIAPDPNPQWSVGDPNLVQPNLTDLQFIQSLAVRHRARAFVEYCKYPENGGSEASYFFFVPEAQLARQRPGASLRCCSGFHELIEFRYERVSTAAAPYRPSAVIDPRDGTTVTHTVTRDPPAPAATPSPEREAAADAQGVGDPYRSAMTAAASAPTTPEAMTQELRAAGLPSEDPVLLQTMLQRDPTTIRGLRGQGTAVGNIHLRAKSRVTIKGISAYAEGDWYIRLARHKVENGSYTTELVVTQ